MNKVTNIARYGGHEASVTDFDKAKVVILPVPYEGTVTYRQGTKNGPLAIIEASRNMEIYDEELNVETHKVGIYTMPLMDLVDATPEGAVESVCLAVKNLLSASKFPVVIGGEHSISLGAIKAVKETVGDFSVLHFDAHSDMRNEYGGTKYNHTCVGRRIQEIAPITQLGIRSMSKEDKEFIDSKGNISRVITAYDILNDALWD